MTPIRTLAAADDDLLLAADRLEAARRGFGGRLLDTYRHAVEAAETQPRFHPQVDDPVPGYECRNAAPARYRYRVIYVVLPAELLIVAVAHTSMRPGSWHDRLPTPPP